MVQAGGPDRQYNVPVYRGTYLLDEQAFAKQLAESYFIMLDDARMNPDGTLLYGPSDTGGIAINASKNGGGSPSVAFDGTNYFVVWTVASFSNNPPAGIFAARVSTDGGLIDGPSTGTGISISGLPPSF